MEQAKKTHQAWMKCPTPQVFTKWSDEKKYSDSLVRCRVPKSSKSLKWEFGPNKDTLSYGTWAIYDTLFVKAMKSKSRVKVKEE